jgi:hypothetical protein
MITIAILVLIIDTAPRYWGQPLEVKLHWAL